MTGFLAQESSVKCLNLAEKCVSSYGKILEEVLIYYQTSLKTNLKSCSFKAKVNIKLSKMP